MAEDHEHNVNGAGYEVDDASVREVVLTGVFLAIGTIVVCLAVAGLLKVLTHVDTIGTTPMTQIPTAQTFPPEPRIQVKPWQELQEVRAREDALLNTYGWVNKDAGRVRIPIDRAMQEVVQRGLPVRTGGTQTGAGAAKTGNPEGNVPSQAIGYPPKGSGAKSNAPQQ